MACVKSLVQSCPVQLRGGRNEILYLMLDALMLNQHFNIPVLLGIVVKAQAARISA